MLSWNCWIIIIFFFKFQVQPLLGFAWEDKVSVPSNSRQSSEPGDEESPIPIRANVPSADHWHAVHDPESALRGADDAHLPRVARLRIRVPNVDVRPLHAGAFQICALPAAEHLVVSRRLQTLHQQPGPLGHLHHNALSVHCLLAIRQEQHPLPLTDWHLMPFWEMLKIISGK